jgi:hypothetical protein
MGTGACGLSFEARRERRRARLAITAKPLRGDDGSSYGGVREARRATAQAVTTNAVREAADYASTSLVEATVDVGANPPYELRRFTKGKIPWN